MIAARQKKKLPRKGSNFQPLDLLCLTVERASQLRHGGFDAGCVVAVDFDAILEIPNNYILNNCLLRHGPFRHFGAYTPGRWAGWFCPPCAGQSGVRNISLPWKHVVSTSVRRYQQIVRKNF